MMMWKQRKSQKLMRKRNKSKRKRKRWKRKKKSSLPKIVPK